MLGALIGTWSANRGAAPAIEVVSAPVTFPFTSGGAYFNSRFSLLGFRVSSPYPVYSYYSDDIGQTWTRIDEALNAELRTLIQGPDRLVVLSGNSATGNRTAVTLDGVNWTKYTANLPSSGYWYDGVWDGTYYLGANYSNNTLAQSTDGITWTTRIASGVTTTGIEALAYGNGIYLAGHRNNPNIYKSTDGGFTWTVSSARPYSLTGLNFENGRFFAQALSDTGVVASTVDGVTWTTHTMPGVTGVVAPPIWVTNAGRWFTRSNAGGLMSWAMWSDDLNTWHQIDVPIQLNGALGAPMTDGTTVVGLAMPNSLNGYGYRVVNL